MEINTSEGKLALTLCTISRKSVNLQKSQEPRINNETREYLQLMQKITAGSEVRESADAFSYVPGSIQGGSILFECVHCSVPDVLASVLPLVVFCRIPVHLTVRGVTNSQAGISVDFVKAVHCKIMSQFGVVSEIKINRRAIYPSADGEVLLMAEHASALKPIVCDRREELRRIIGVNYSARISSDILHRVSTSEREQLKTITPSVKIYNDIGNSKTSGKTPGHGCLLLAFGNSSIYEAEYTVDGSDSLLESSPEERVDRLIQAFYKNIRSSGSYSHRIQHFVFVLMALTTVDGSAVVIRKISKKDREVLHLLESILKYSYTIEPYVKTEHDVNSGLPDGLLLIKSCGVGYTNIYKPMQ
ncbi:RNA 3'-terminal phosphate cyclase-like protein [Nematocida major]|uniref:RNA 3'-terminal phosphate cyclase-like protein n=1 Tax=Nematocida major TaxID=1912982 RepID=UPI002007456D|nr:RNA 3'-terminal phosphate cyclase-like protein [Nematocida major]KAH9385644.1 RNA 3'-terminal phosphate cyclase-like protein [Nematocida major]